MGFGWRLYRGGQVLTIAGAEYSRRFFGNGARLVALSIGPTSGCGGRRRTALVVTFGFTADRFAPGPALGV
jgi:hypothetical protein